MQLITTIQDIAKNLSEGKQVDAILLDFSKAFDKVPHERLLLLLCDVESEAFVYVEGHLPGFFPYF
jgi:hypothetical protein